MFTHGFSRSQSISIASRFPSDVQGVTQECMGGFCACSWGFHFCFCCSSGGKCHWNGLVHLLCAIAAEGIFLPALSNEPSVMLGGKRLRRMMGRASLLGEGQFGLGRSEGPPLYVGAAFTPGLPPYALSCAPNSLKKVEVGFFGSSFPSTISFLPWKVFQVTLMLAWWSWLEFSTVSVAHSSVGVSETSADQCIILLAWVWKYFLLHFLVQDRGPWLSWFSAFQYQLLWL